MRKGYYLAFAFLMSIITAIVLSACSNNASDSQANEMAAETTEAGWDSNVSSESVEMKRGDSSQAKSDSSSQHTDNNNVALERMVIYNASLSIDVKDYGNVETMIQQKTRNIGGYVVESTIYHHNDEQISGHLVVKVPQTHFETFLYDVEEESVKVNDRSVTGQDITEEYVDLESRLKSKRTVEERLLSFMEKAENTEDLLTISRDLATVQEEIERITGRMNYLKNNVDFSTVTIYMTETNVKVASLQDKESLNTWAKAKHLFMETVNSLVTFFSSLIVIVIGLSPLLIFLVVVILAIIFYRKRINKEKRL